MADVRYEHLSCAIFVRMLWLGHLPRFQVAVARTLAPVEPRLTVVGMAVALVTFGVTLPSPYKARL